MLIRSQSRKWIVNMDCIESLRITDNNAINADTSSASYIIGKYSTEEKALKVLDMIQDAYVRCEGTRTLTTGTAFEIAREIRSEERVIEYQNIHRGVFVFQMLQDDEV